MAKKNNAPATSKNVYVPRKVKGITDVVREHTQYGRKCQTCRSVMLERRIGSGKISGRTVCLYEVFCPNNCCYDFQPSPTEIRVMKAVTEVRHGK